ncbi:MAG TPA: hypothetical protein VI072_23265 [Polyangiaceae bacterium]
MNAHAGPAGEPPAWVALGWDGGAQGAACLQPAELEEAVEARLGRVVFSGNGEASARLTVNYVEPLAAEGWRVSIAIAESDDTIWGERSLSTPEGDCRALDDPLILAVALMVDSELMRARTRAVPQHEQPAEAPRPAAPPPAVETAPGFAAWRRETLELKGALQVGPVLGQGVLPNSAWGVHVAGSVSAGILPPLRVRADLFLPQRVALAPAGHLELSRFTLGAGLCPAHESRIYELGACAGLSAAILRTSSTGLVQSRRFIRTTAVFDASLRGNWVFAPSWTVGVESGIGVPLERPVYVYERPGLADQSVFRTSPVTFSATVALGARFR